MDYVSSAISTLNNRNIRMEYRARSSMKGEHQVLTATATVHQHNNED